MVIGTELELKITYSCSFLRPGHLSCSEHIVEIQRILCGLQLSEHSLLPTVERNVRM